MGSAVILKILLLVGVAILLFLPTVWAIRDVAHRRFPSLKVKIIWFAVISLLPPVGGMIYIVVGRPRTEISGEPAEGEEVDGGKRE
jgi:hypothetical protein